MRLVTLHLLFFLLLGAAWADPYTLRVDVSPSPAVVGRGHVTVETSPGLTADAQASMPSMPAMGALSVPLKETQPGRYEGDVVYAMGGDWQLAVHVRGPNGEARSAVPVTVGTETSSPAPAGDGSTLSVGTTSPARVGLNTVQVEVRNAQGQPRDDLQVAVGLTMPGMSMYVRPRAAERRAPGRYEASVFLAMAGPWSLTADVRTPTAPVGVKTVTLNVAAPLEVGSRWGTAGLLLFAVGVLVLALRRQPHPAWLFPVLACLVTTAAIGEAVRAHWTPDRSMGMAMDMTAPDMGMSQAVFGAPVPVMLETVGPHPLLAAVSAAGTVVSAANPATVRARLSRNEAGELPGGALAAVLSPAPQQNAYLRGHLTSVSHQVDAATQTVTVEASVPNTGGVLWPGQLVALTLQVARKDDALTVPIQAVSQYYGAPSVWVVTQVAGQSLARRRSVVVGLMGTERTEIVSGLSLGEQVVVAGGEALLEDAVVAPVQRGPAVWENLLLPPYADSP